jgi:hypothetical protein
LAGYAARPKLVEIWCNQWGRYTIVEIRNFARFSGIEAAQNIKNFQVMESTSIADKGKQGLQTVINNLKLSLQRWYRPKHQQAVVTDVALSPLLENIPADGIEQESENCWILRLDKIMSCSRMMPKSN